MAEKPSWLYNQSAAIPYRINAGILEILLVTTRKRKHWIVPKGVIEPDLSPQESAAAEAFEEAGVKGCVMPDKVGEYAYTKWGGTCHVRVYLLEVDEVFSDWPEANLRNRCWLSASDAVSLVDIPALKTMISHVPEMLL